MNLSIMMDLFSEENWGTSSRLHEDAQKNYSDRTPGLRETLRNTFSEKVASMWKTVTTPVSEDRDQGAVAYDLQNSRLDPNMETIENWLNRFGQPTILLRLDKSLEGVKRNQISKKCHEQLSELVDKELRRLSLTVHPDHSGNHEWQSALNAIRKVLKTLTAVFLENIFIDYKYEYFSKLDINVLVNENEINKTIQAMFYKISVLSETKRMNIIGEIRKFLTESERCVKSFFEGQKSDFQKHRDYALYHLQKNIEGYKKLEKECNIVIEECRKENENMRAAVENVVRQSLSESSILRSLEHVARHSFQGHFEIFPVNKAMDEYYILPFVDYVNLLSMCNFLLQPKCSRFSSQGFTFNAEERARFCRAYILASYIYNFRKGHMKTRTESIREYEEKLRNLLGEIFQVLQKKYKVDAYNEGKSNREEMYEKLVALKRFLGDLQEKEKTFGERLSRYKTENSEPSESVVNCRRDTEGSIEVGSTKQEKESEEDSSKFSSLLEDEKIVKELYECKEELSEITSTEEKWVIVEDSKVAEEIGEDCLNKAYL